MEAFTKQLGEVEDELLVVLWTNFNSCNIAKNRRMHLWVHQYSHIRVEPSTNQNTQRIKPKK